MTLWELTTSDPSGVPFLVDLGLATSPLLPQLPPQYNGMLSSKHQTYSTPAVCLLWDLCINQPPKPVRRCFLLQLDFNI